MGGVVKGVTRALGLSEDPAKAAAAQGRISAAAGREAAGAIKKEPFDLSKRLSTTKKRAGEEFESGKARRGEALAASTRQRQRLEDTAAGKGPSLAEAQLKSAADRTLSQQLAAAASQRGGSAAATQRQLQRGQAQSGRELGQQAATMRIQESQAAQQQLGAQLAQERAAGDQLVNNFLRLGMTVEQAEAGAQQELERLRQGARAGGAAQAGQAFSAAQGREQQMMGSLIGGGATLLASDENLKKNIKDGDKEVKSFLDALSAKEYEYKDPSQKGTAEGPRVGIIAQDLEKSNMGKTLVKEGPDGKVVDTAQGFGAVLAAQASLNKRMGDFEKALKAKGKKRG